MEQPLRENRKFFRAVTFQNRYFFVMEFFKMKIPKRSYFFQTGSAQHQLFSEELQFGKS